LLFFVSLMIFDLAAPQGGCHLCATPRGAQ
jgi:hypothetical protein